MEQRNRTVTKSSFANRLINTKSDIGIMSALSYVCLRSVTKDSMSWFMDACWGFSGTCHCAPVPLCPRPIVSPSHCVPVPLCPWTVKNFYDLERKCQISAFCGSIFKTAASFFFVVVVVLFCFYCHLKQCSIANFFV